MNSSKEEQDTFSNKVNDCEDVCSIEICIPRNDRRWRNRGNKERRNS